MVKKPEGYPSPTPGPFRLSKSKFLSGLQCHKRLYLQIHSPDLATRPDEMAQAILDMGTSVGELARRRYPGGVLVETDHRHPTEALRRTAELLDAPDVPAIYEGAFRFNNVLVRVDILERSAQAQNGTSSWRLLEVKSSTKVKEVHLDDVALQAYVLLGAGVELDGFGLLHINTRYVYQGGDLDLLTLFPVQDLTEPVRAKQAEVPQRLADMIPMLQAPSPPEIQPDGHCHRPYECPFWAHCTKEKPSRWVYFMPGGEKAIRPWLKQDIQTMDQIPKGMKLTPTQRRLIENVEWISPRLKEALQAVRYPLHHLDFETFMPAIPKFPLTRPYQAIPTQWSNHIETEDGNLRHEEFLCMEAKDPREELVRSLIDSLGEQGSICVYSAYERAILERLADAFPLLSRELNAVIRRLWDLYLVIRDHYYHPGFNGSYSIKSVFPVLVPELGYDDLDIKEGGMAAQWYDRMVFQETDWVEKVRIREALLKYCERDTLAMVEIRRVLVSKTQLLPS